MPLAGEEATQTHETKNQDDQRNEIVLSISRGDRLILK